MQNMYKADYDNLPPHEKSAWNFDHYQRTRATIDNGLDIAMIIGMMDLAREQDIRYKSLIKVIEGKVFPEYSREQDELESMFANSFREVLIPLLNEHKY